MKQLVVLIRKREWENAVWADYFRAEPSENPEETFRQAVQEYLMTEDGKEAIKATSEDFNWGDAVMDVPKEQWMKHGLEPLQSGDSVVIHHTIEVIVDQDEVLIPQSYYDEDED